MDGIIVHVLILILAIADVICTIRFVRKCEKCEQDLLKALGVSIGAVMMINKKKDEFSHDDLKMFIEEAKIVVMKTCEKTNIQIETEADDQEEDFTCEGTE